MSVSLSYCPFWHLWCLSVSFKLSFLALVVSVCVLDIVLLALVVHVCVLHNYCPIGAVVPVPVLDIVLVLGLVLVHVYCLLCNQAFCCQYP